MSLRTSIPTLLLSCAVASSAAAQDATSTSTQASAATPAPAKKLKTKVKWGGWVRAGFRKTFAERDVIGSDDGFELDVARLKISGKRGPFTGVVQFQVRSSKDLAWQILDLFVNYKAADAMQLKVGRFKAPYDFTSVDSTKKRWFIDTPIHSHGVSSTYGVKIGKINQSRQLGMMLHAKRPLGGLVDVNYQLAFTNGPGEGGRNADGNWGGYARAGVYIGPIEVGGAAFLSGQDVSSSTAIQRQTGQAAFIRAEYMGFKFKAEQLLVISKLSGVETRAFAVNGQLSYEYGPYYAGYRGEYYNPLDGRPQVEHSVVIGRSIPQYKLRLGVNGTVLTEVDRLSVPNNRVMAFGQYNF